MAFAHRCFHLLSLGGQLLAWNPRAFITSQHLVSPKLAALPTGKGAQTQLVTACPKQPLQGAGQKACPPFRDSWENPAASLGSSASWPLHTLLVPTETASSSGKEEASVAPPCRCQDCVYTGSSSRNKTGQSPGGPARAAEPSKQSCPP